MKDHRVLKIFLNKKRLISKSRNLLKDFSLALENLQLKVSNKNIHQKNNYLRYHAFRIVIKKNSSRMYNSCKYKR